MKTHELGRSGLVSTTDGTNGHFWRKAAYHETWSTVDGPYDEQNEQCGFACSCDISAKSTIKEERPWPDRTGNINLRGTGLRQRATKQGVSGAVAQRSNEAIRLNH